ncbi:YesN17 [Paenibacillus mucilaginosus 3016]|uniref:YesN17 n=1 Tax=Paenibacillus mucilaginosus 3016 TaxID=1116391 RepID=H6NLL8_9BACL|nr:response regulator [Paenibacillus mucilaginosus]AFC30952.1 YesN17 [Paenibacillus mucilaginosus 3016]WFA19546.1 response regulator [Paenibacillus mucilaginosus]
MYHILLVDDEASVVDSLEVSLPWAELNIETVHKAYSAQEALEILNRHPVDIVLTDIRMPEMSGIELSDVIRSRWKGISVVFLTGHADFEYARHAVEIQAADYILKPFRNDSVTAALRSIMERKQQEWQARHSLQSAVYALREHLPLLRSRLLNDLLSGKSFAPELLAHKQATLQLPFKPGEPCGLVIVRIEEDPADAGPDDPTLMEYAVLNIAEEVLHPYFRLWSCRDAQDYLVLLVQPVREEIESGLQREAVPALCQQLLEKLASEVKSSVKNYLKAGLSLLVGPWGMYPGGLAAAYGSALTCFRSRIGRERELLFTYQEPPAECVRPGALQSLYQPPTLSQLLESGRWNEAKGKLEDILAEVERLAGGPLDVHLEAFWSIAASFSYLSHKHGRPVPGLWSASGGLPPGGYPRSVRQLADWSREKLSRLEGEMEREARDSRSELVRKVQRFAQEMLDKDISLQAISEHVGLNPSYLSRIYKLETGESISDTIYKLRMEQAAYYLRSTELKIYEITARLGYQYPPYFIKVFKQHYGVTPQEYRDGREGTV